jgi:hypothetical protein
MNSPHDYLEFSFEDYFGQWDAVIQQFQPAIRHRGPQRCDDAFSRTNLLARLLQSNFSGLPRDIMAGLALLWCGSFLLEISVKFICDMQGFCCNCLCAGSPLRAYMEAVVFLWFLWKR